MDKLVQRIDVAYQNAPKQKARRYIGASGLGECEAEMAYSLRGFPSVEPEPRIARVFGLGHVIEDIVVADLKMAGYHIEPVDPTTGKQWEYKAFGGHVVCHLDGKVAVPGGWAVLEVKSMNKNMFGKLQREGVVCSHPKYFNQMQACMMLSGLDSAMLVVYCKDNSDYHIEIVHLNQLQVSHLELMIHKALTNEARRIASIPSFFKCKLCFKRDVCHGTAPVEVPRNCATCVHSMAHASGGWLCTQSEEVKHADDVCANYSIYAAMPL